jgi:hypothetical protein
MLPHFWRDKEEQASILVEVLKQLPEPWYLWIAHHFEQITGGDAEKPGTLLKHIEIDSLERRPIF